MQLELDPLSMLVGGILTILGIVIMIGIQKGAEFSYRALGNRILEWYRKPRSGLQVEVVDRVHTRERGRNIIWVQLELMNQKKSVSRISSILIKDKKGHELECQSDYKEQFEIYSNDSMTWSCFCQDERGKDCDKLKLKLEVSRREGKKIKKKFLSFRVDEKNFPARTRW